MDKSNYNPVDKPAQTADLGQTVETLNDFYVLLRNKGYDESDIEEIFDLEISLGMEQ